ncbi:DUF924 family protein [Melittangium boletus]|uniref:DUF924 family protein n=1 Tax=Melittangium boletus TaxID=83453 RepID=UPI003DA1D332
MIRPDDVLSFWFGPVSDPEAHQPRAHWFQRDEAFDAACAQRLTEAHEQAAKGQLDTWKDEPRSALALVLLLDQVPRNLYRDTARAYATDAQARAVARHALARGLDVPLPPVWRWFLYLPFEHSEDLNDQRLSVSLFELPGRSDEVHTQTAEYARRHRDIIERFGRFPHRNGALGRESTPEEVAFLQEPDSSF